MLTPKELNAIYPDQDTLHIHPQKQRVRNIAYTAVFGSLWGFSEFFLGSLLHAMQIPMRGHVLQAIGVLIAFTGALFIKRDFSVLRIGMIAAFFKMFSFGGGNTLPVIMAILIQSLIADLFLLLIRKNKPGYIIAGGMGFLWIPINMPLYNLMLFGDEIIEPIMKNGMRFLEYLRIPDLIEFLGFQVNEGLLFILVFIFAINFIFGGLMGLIAFVVGKQIKTNLGIE